MTRLNTFDASLLAGFREGMTFADLRAARHRGPEAMRGVYAVVYPFDSEREFLKVGTGGCFKKRDPNVVRGVLDERWVPKSRLLYFGRAGAPGENGNMHERIRLFSWFGQGSKVGHWGGRYIWHVKGSANLLIRWQPMPDGVPRQTEHRLIRAFVSRYDRMPFANLAE